VTNQPGLFKMERFPRSGTISAKTTRVPGTLGQLFTHSLFFLAPTSNPPPIFCISSSMIFLKCIFFSPFLFGNLLRGLL
jgi:hypothetical protein